MSHSRVRFQVCLCAALLATVLEIAGVSVAAACAAQAPGASAVLAEGKLVGAGHGATLR
jgi:hypothetical protein